MANTYTQLFIQVVFVVQGRKNLIPQNKKEELHKYITGIIQKRNHKLLAINCMPDLVHILIGYNPAQSLPDLMRDIKSNASKFINEKQWIKGKFEWQIGYGAFTYSKSDVCKVISYIQNQESHHKKRSTKDEYLLLLKKFEIEYDEKYMFDWIK